MGSIMGRLFKKKLGTSGLMFLGVLVSIYAFQNCSEMRALQETPQQIAQRTANNFQADLDSIQSQMNQTMGHAGTTSASLQAAISTLQSLLSTLQHMDPSKGSMSSQAQYQQLILTLQSAITQL